MPTHAFTTRPVQPTDEDLLFQIYSSTRADEMIAWGWNTVQQKLFLQMQFQAQQRHYAAQFPFASHQIIICEAQPVGQLLVARTTSEIRLVDIALLPAYRQRGIGTQLIQQLLAEAKQVGLPVRLHVLKLNIAAARLYSQLGFVTIHDEGAYLLMES